MNGIHWLGTALVLLIASLSWSQAVPPEPTALEQYMLELINRARANPQAEAARHGVALNEGPPTYGAERGMVPISGTPKQPLALDLRLSARARENMRWQVDNPGSAGANSPVPSARAQGIAADILPRTLTVGSIVGVLQSVREPTAAEVATAQRNLFRDQNALNAKGERTDDRHHRVIMLWDGYSVIGVGFAQAKVAENGKFRGMMGCDLYNTEVYFLTGVAYRDTDRDQFYTPGEGLGRVQVRAVRRSDGAVFSASTWGSGGYTLQVPAGVYDLGFSGGGSQKTVAGVEVRDRNVKVDYVVAGN